MADLQRALTEVISKFPNIDEVRIGFADDHNEARAVAGHRRESNDTSTYASCLAKLFTSTLLSHLIVQSKIKVNDEVVALLGIEDQSARRPLEGITLVQLVNHTHGLDDSTIGHVPISPSGSIDAGALCAQFAPGLPMAIPGCLYNYGSLGGYLAGAIIERQHNRIFRNVLAREILTPLRIRFKESHRGGDENLLSACPATGGKWLLSADDMLALLGRHLGLGYTSDHSLRGHLGLMLSSGEELPGWNPNERGVNFGWKRYGGDWFGHDGRWNGSSILGMVNPRHRVAIAISTHFSTSDPVYPLVASLFGDIFPELATIDVPVLLSAEAARDLNPEAYCGTFQTRAETVRVFAASDSLHMRLIRNDGGNERAARANRDYRLRPARQNIFMISPAAPERSSYLQFLAPSQDARYEYLWNGRNIWRRVGNQLQSRSCG